jgi:molybdopterin/thiamine biosynthesis adenylyltransferase
MGCLQAAEAMKLLIRRAGKSAPQKSSSQKLTMVDMRSGSCQQLELARNPDCPVCGPSGAGAQPR